MDMTFGYISASIGRIFPELHTSRFPRMCYIWCKFRRERSVIKDIVFGEQSSFSTIPKFLLEAFSWNFIPGRQHARAKSIVSFVVIGQ